jgi:hypothetical protein|tara:strand:- start:3444 stop:3731 length:288 start_codon:yes stop_codon:yes gene_type:complete
MPLSTALPTLKLDIWLALETARTSISAGAEEGKKPTDINKQLGADIGDAIHFYTTQAVVDTTVITVLAGIAAPLAPAGAAPVAGAGAGKGFGILL